MVHVIAVGGGYGDITVAGGLDSVAEVALVEQKDRSVHHAAALRVVVDSIRAHTIFMPYPHLLKNDQVIQNKTTKVEGITVRLATHEPVTADYLVLAMGSTYPYPAKQDQPNTADAKARLEETWDNPSRVCRVLLVGAGTIGIEFAGELTSDFPDVEVVMVGRAPYILGSSEYIPQLRDVLARELEESGARLILGSPLSLVPPTEPGVYQPFHVETQGEVGVDANIWFLCYGTQTASGHLQSTRADRLGEESQPVVDEHSRAESSENVYAVGDLTDVPESKRADAARVYA